MKKILFGIILLSALLSAFCVQESLFAEGGSWKIELVKAKVDSKTENSKWAPFNIYKTDRKSGESTRVCDLQGVGVYKPGKYQYDGKKDVLIIHDLGNTTQYIKIVDLKQKKVVKIIEIPTFEPDLDMLINPSNGVLYISFWDPANNAWRTWIFNQEYEAIKKNMNFTVIGERVWFSDDGKHFYIVNSDKSDKKEYLMVIDALSGGIVSKKAMTNLSVKGEYARIRDCKKGILLLEYRIKNNKDAVETYVLYEPQTDKVLSRMINNVPYHIGSVYLDDSLNGFIISEAKSISIGNKRSTRKYTGKIKVYDFAKQKMIKEIDIGDTSTVEIVDNGTIYYRQDNKIKKAEFLK